jgi:hypothetical protein
MKEIIERIDQYERAYNIINFGVFDANTEAELNRKATLNSIMLKIRKDRKELLTLLSEEMGLEKVETKQNMNP